MKIKIPVKLMHLSVLPVLLLASAAAGASGGHEREHRYRNHEWREHHHRHYVPPYYRPPAYQPVYRPVYPVQLPPAPLTVVIPLSLPIPLWWFGQ
jgi:hypothetical protein